MRKILLGLCITLGFSSKAFSNPLSDPLLKQVAQSTKSMFGAYLGNVKVKVDQTQHIPTSFAKTLYEVFTGVADKKKITDVDESKAKDNPSERVNKATYKEKAWLFENTMALLGTFYETKEVYYDVYQRNIQALIGVIDSGKIQGHFDVDPSTGIVLESRLKAYYTAVAIGVLAGIGPGFIPVPDRSQGIKYGEVATPIYKYRVGMQQLRVAVLNALTYRIAYARAELATLYYFAQTYCEGSEWIGGRERVPGSNRFPIQLPGAPSIPIPEPSTPGTCDTLAKGSGTLCYSNVVQSIRDLKESLLRGLDVLAGQQGSGTAFACLSILTQLHNTKALIDNMEINLYLLSTNYSLLAHTEKTQIK